MLPLRIQTLPVGLQKDAVSVTPTAIRKSAVSRAGLEVRLICPPEISRSFLGSTTVIMPLHTSMTPSCLSSPIVVATDSRVLTIMAASSSWVRRAPIVAGWATSGCPSLGISGNLSARNNRTAANLAPMLREEMRATNSW